MNRIFTGMLVLSLLGNPVAHASQVLSLEPVPTGEEDSIQAQLGRHRGQTRFLNYHGAVSRGGYPGAPMPGAQERADKGGARAIQESDVFKIGKPGAKILYLLNQYRGLQVVSFAKGAENPELLGRTDATGNYPDDMYLDEANERILVLERLWRYENGEQMRSRIVVYDVRNPAEPKQVEELKLEGDIADSRLVGNVLYVASAVNRGQDGAKGTVTAIALKQAGVSVVQRADLSLPVSYRENMNIVRTEEGRYYLVAILSQTGWGWWDRQSLVELVDISDPNGAIAPVMVVSARGRVNERSQTHIKNGTLIVVSNYRADDEQTGPSRIAVEAFKLPTDKTKAITEQEAEFRRLRIDRELAGKSGDEREKTYRKLIADTELGIQGVFVREAKGTLRKLVADSVSTVGDTQGLHAMLQDVRFEGDRLYAFWVPQNQIDPLDVFDISQPDQAVKHLKRLYFDGWIQRAIPIKHQGRDFILGLGWIVPSENNEHNQRFPQAMLFEIEKRGTGLEPVVKAQVTLSSVSWANFNGADKYIEVRDNGDGTGSVMFQMDVWGERRYQEGAKLVGFNLNDAISGNGPALSEGAFLAADSGWLRRVFTNPEIAKLNSFSNEALATFEIPSVSASSQVATSISVLELARSIQGYVTLGSGSSTRGVQIIQARGNTTAVRLVNPAMADAEKSATFAEVTLPGQYQHHLVDAQTQSLWVVTRKTFTRAENEYVNQTLVHRLSLDGSAMKLEIRQKAEWENRPSNRSDRGPVMQPLKMGVMPPYFGWHSSRLVQLGSGEVVLITGSEIRRLGGEGDGVAVVSTEGCPVTDESNPEFQVVSGRLFLTSMELVEDPSRKDVLYSRHFLSPVQLAGGAARCGKAVNIPGKPLMISVDPASGAIRELVTQDQKLLDLVKRTYEMGDHREYTWYEAALQSALMSLNLKGEGVASLEDDFEQENEYLMMQDLGGMRLAFLQKGRFVALGLDGDHRFTKKTWLLAGEGNEQLNEEFRLSQVIDTRDGKGTLLAVVSDGSKFRVYHWSGALGRPEPVMLAPLDAHFRPKATVSTISLPGWYFYWGEARTMHYTPSTGTLEIPGQMYGVHQFLLK